jgi:hypothetical protein
MNLPDMPPEKLHFEISGVFRESHGVDWRDGWLWHRQTQAGFVPGIETRVALEPRQWKSFWQAFETADVWHWRTDHDSDIFDGTQWSSKLRRGDLRVEFEGSNPNAAV